MPNFFINLTINPADLARARKLEGFDAWLAAYLAEGMKESLDELEDAAQAQMMGSFQNPSGKAETAFRKRVSSPYRAILGNYLPYVQRLNYGFSGMTDSLGRYFSQWPIAAPGGYLWAEGAVDMATPYIQSIFEEKVTLAMEEV